MRIGDLLIATLALYAKLAAAFDHIRANTPELTGLERLADKVRQVPSDRNIRVAVIDFAHAMPLPPAPRVEILNSLRDGTKTIQHSISPSQMRAALARIEDTNS